MKLHELLAVESSLENQAKKVTADLVETFTKKRHLFSKSIVAYQPLAENEKETIEQQSEIQSTVNKELSWINEHLIKSLDASFQVSKTNTIAKADIILEDDTILVKDVPATSLLELEKRMAEIHALVTAIPTLDPAKSFTPDPNTKDLYVAREVNKNRTKKAQRVLVKYEATKEHPAQTELITEDIVTGKIKEQEWSGLSTPAQKAEIINKVEVLTRAIRRARSRANDAEVDKTSKIGKTLLGYIFKD